METEYKDFGFSSSIPHDHLLRLGRFQDERLMWGDGYLKFVSEEGPLQDSLEVRLDGVNEMVYSSEAERVMSGGENEIRYDLDSEEVDAFEAILGALDEDRRSPPRLDMVVERLRQAVEKYGEEYVLTI